MLLLKDFLDGLVFLPSGLSFEVLEGKLLSFDHTHYISA